MNLFRFTSSSKPKADAEDIKTAENGTWKPVEKKPAEKPQKEPHWRVILRHPDGRDVRVEWRSGELDAAKAQLEERIDKAHWLDGGLSSESLPTSAEEEGSSCESPDNTEPDAEGDGKGRDPEARAFAVAAFLEGANLLKIERLDPSAKKMDEAVLPLNGEALKRLKVLRVSGDEVLADGALLAMVQTCLQELDLSSQKLDQQRFEDLLFAKPMPDLSHLRLRKNVLRGFPTSILEQLPLLSELDLSGNKITEVPGSLLQLCPLLEALNLQNNRLTVPAFDFRQCKLRSLLLGLNSLEYIPHMASLTSLSTLSIFSLHVQSRAPRSDTSLIFENLPVHVELLQKSAHSLQLFPYSKRAETELKVALGPLLRSSSSSCHELLASVLARLAEDREYCVLLASETAAKHLLSMCQVPEPVCWDACVAVSRLLSPPVGVWEVTEDNLLLAHQAADILMHALVHSHSIPTRLFLLQALRSMAASSSAMAVSMLAQVMKGAIVVLQDESATQHVQYYVLKLLGELAFVESNRRAMLLDGRVLAAVRALADTKEDGSVDGGGQSAEEDAFPDPRSPKFGVVAYEGEGRSSPAAQQNPNVGGWKPARLRRDDSDRQSPPPIQQASFKAWQRREERTILDNASTTMLVYAARKVMAIMGDNDALRLSTGLTSGYRRGIRVLSVDGGGVKGIASIRMLAELEARCGRPLYTLFDLICGTSAGGIIACAMGNKLNMQECERVYRVVSRKAFSVMKVKEGAEEEEMASTTGWWTRFVAGSSTVRRVLLSGAKYDALPMMQAMEENFSWFCKEPMIENSVDCRNCKVAVVSTCCSQRPICPYVFRSYQHPPGTKLMFDGACRHSWLDALRATSAAPYFFEEFACGGERFQDGAIAANNPSIVALHEAQNLWPGRNVDLMVSVGTGRAPISRRAAKTSSSGWGLMETFGEFMVESATSSDRVQEAVEVMSSMIPNTSFFRLQVTDEKCDVEIDDLSAEANSGLIKAAEKFIESNGALYADCAAVLMHGWEDQADAGARSQDKAASDPLCQAETQGGDERGRAHEPADQAGIRAGQKKGLGVGLTGLVVESRLGEEEDGGAGVGGAESMVALLDAVGVPSTLRSFRVGGSADDPRLDARSLAGMLRESSAGLVYVACETLRSGGDLVLDWSWQPMELSPWETAVLLLRSSSHCDVDGLEAVQALRPERALSPIPAQEPELAAHAACAEGVQAAAAKAGRGAAAGADGRESGGAQEGLEGAGAADHQPDTQPAEARDGGVAADGAGSAELAGAEGVGAGQSPVAVEAQSASTQSAASGVEDAGAGAGVEVEGGAEDARVGEELDGLVVARFQMEDLEDDPHPPAVKDLKQEDGAADCKSSQDAGATSPAEDKDGAAIVREDRDGDATARGHDGADKSRDGQAGVENCNDAGKEEHAFEEGEEVKAGDVNQPGTDEAPADADQAADETAGGQEETPGEPGESAEDDNAGETQRAASPAEAEADAAVEMSEEQQSMLKALCARRVVDVSPLERWVFLPEDPPTEGGGLTVLRFGKAKASQITGWEALVGATGGGGGALRDKVVMLRHAVPMATARLVVDSGAAAVLMPSAEAGQVPESVRRECLREALRLLAEGRSPAFAVAQANGILQIPPLTCVY